MWAFILGFIVFSTSAGVLDSILDSKETKEGKKNDAWYAANKANIAVKLQSLSWNTNSSTIQFNGTIENLSDEKIAAVVMDITIVNSSNKQEALRERIKILTPVFKSETYRLPRLQRTLVGLTFANDSDLLNCLDRLHDISFSFDVVTVISARSAFEGYDYYKIKSEWQPWQPEKN